MLLWDATRLTVKGVGATVNAGREYAVAHEADIANGAKVAVHGLGTAVRYSGKLVARGATTAGSYLHGKATASDNTTVKVAGHFMGYVADAAGLVGEGTAKVGELTGKVAPALGTATGGGLRGAVDMVSGAVDTVAISEHDFEQLRRQLRSLGAQAQQRSERKLSAIRAAQRSRRKRELLDHLVVGGVTLSAALRAPGSVPTEVLEAYALAYPGLAARESFTDVVGRLSPNELIGFVSGVKGKLFEIGLVDHLNAGALPDGWHAEMAHAANEPGWDIRVLDSNGQVAEVLQAKATQSVAYVREALERYPDIDVTTTSEVHSQLVAMGMAEHVRDGGVTETLLDAKVNAAVHAAGQGFDAGELLPSSAGLAVIALSTFMDRGLTLEQRGAEFGNRSARAVVASGAGKLAMAATQTWWLGLIAGVGSSWLVAKGRGKRERYEALKQMVASMQVRQQALPRPTQYVALAYRPSK